MSGIVIARNLVGGCSVVYGDGKCDPYMFDSALIPAQNWGYILLVAVPVNSLTEIYVWA